MKHKKRHGKWVRLVTVLFLGWLVVAGTVSGISGFLGKRIVQSLKAGEVGRAERYSLLLQNTLDYGWSLTGLRFLPVTHTYYRLAEDANRLAQLTLNLLKKAEPMASALFAGTEINQLELEKLLLEMDQIGGQLLPFAGELQQPEVRLLAQITGTTKELNTTVSDLQTAFESWQKTKPLLDRMPSILGYERPKRYLVLFQNNMELRPTGGFVGSYGDLTFEKGALKRLEIQDIYAPDGQIKGYVKEPEPLRKYLFRGETPGWRLRDSNWDPDFVRASRDMEWFFAEGGIEPIDGIIAITLEPILEVLKTMGPLYLPDYSIEVTAENFYQQAQYQAEHEFFPGSTQKRDFLGSVGRQLLWRIEEGKLEDIGPLLSVVAKSLEERQIMVSLFQPEDASFFAKNGFDGHLPQPFCPENYPNCQADFLAVNEANVGITKANCCIERHFSDVISLSPKGDISHHLTLEFKNLNPPTPQPPVAWGGGYKNYLRIIVPESSVVEGVAVNGVSVPPEDIRIESEDGLLYVGFLILIEGTQTGVAEISYHIPSPSKNLPYYLKVYKQPGVSEMPWTISSAGMGNGLLLEQHKSQPLPSTEFGVSRDFWVQFDLKQIGN